MSAIESCKDGSTGRGLCRTDLIAVDEPGEELATLRAERARDEAFTGAFEDVRGRFVSVTMGDEMLLRGVVLLEDGGSLEALLAVTVPPPGTVCLRV